MLQNFNQIKININTLNGITGAEVASIVVTHMNSYRTPQFVKCKFEEPISKGILSKCGKILSK